jgi:hypothetical protein
MDARSSSSVYAPRWAFNRAMPLNPNDERRLAVEGSANCQTLSCTGALKCSRPADRNH